MTTNEQQQPHGVSWTKTATATAVLCLAACASQQTGEPQPSSLALMPDASWFECHGRFDCAVVYDANICAERAVNTRHALKYETWAREFLARAGESRDCAPDPDAEPRAVCRDLHCEIAENNLDALIEYTR